MTDKLPKVERMRIPTIGTTIKLHKPWALDVYRERRNQTMLDVLVPGTHGWRDSADQKFGTTLPAGTILVVDRIYIRQQAEDYDSLTFWVAWCPSKKFQVKKLRFWAKLCEVNKIVYTPVEDAELEEAREKMKKVLGKYTRSAKAGRVKPKDLVAGKIYRRGVKGDTHAVYLGRFRFVQEGHPDSGSLVYLFRFVRSYNTKRFTRIMFGGKSEEFVAITTGITTGHGRLPEQIKEEYGGFHTFEVFGPFPEGALRAAKSPTVYTSLDPEATPASHLDKNAMKERFRAISKDQGGFHDYWSPVIMERLEKESHSLFPGEIPQCTQVNWEKISGDVYAEFQQFTRVK